MDHDALAPLARWATPLLSPALDRMRARWAAEARRRPDLFDDERVQDSIAHAFVDRAVSWSCRTLLLELAIARHRGALPGDSPASRFAAFLDWIDSRAGREAIDHRAPLLRGDVTAQAQLTERFLGQLLDRLLADEQALVAITGESGMRGPLMAFDTGLGDRHDGGASVVRLRFERCTIAYKPRAMATDAAFANLLARLSGDGIDPDLRAPAAIDRGRYGYAEWIASTPLDDASEAGRYYVRYGALVAIAYLLNAGDLHLENLIAHGAHPVLVDLETLVQPCMVRNGEISGRAPIQAPSVLQSGLMPFADGANPDDRETSALSWEPFRFQGRRAVDAGTDALRLEPFTATAQPGANLPRHRDGSPALPFDHGDSAARGFEAMYRGLLRCRSSLRGRDGWLAPFAAAQTRALVRSTHIYGRLLEALSHPAQLASPAARGDVLDKLAAGIPRWPFLARTIASERAALARGDVPRFRLRATSTTIHDDDGRRVAGVFQRSGWREVQRRVRGLSERDLHRQRYALAQAFESLRPSAEPDRRVAARPIPAQTSTRPPARKVFVAEAVAIGDALLALCFLDRDGIACYQPEYRANDRPVLSAMGMSLYDGIPGLMLAFAELGMQSGARRFTRAAEVALATCRDAGRDDPNFATSAGAFTGLGGWIHALCVLGLRWRRADLVDEAKAWLPTLRELIECDRELDVIGGAAGCLLVLSAMRERWPADPRIVEACAACARRLVAQAQQGSDGVWWADSAGRGEALTGFAHGAAGIAAALARHAWLSGDAEAMTIAREGLRFERHAFHRRGGSWYDLDVEREAAQAACDDETVSWCHGASGVGLARCLLPSALRDDAWRADIASCVSTTLRHGVTGGDSLCHGRLGNLELAMQVGRDRGDRSAVAHCRALAGAGLPAAQERWQGGGRSAAECPLGLMVGWAGIAYGYLRMAAPDEVASVLSLSLPA